MTKTGVLRNLEEIQEDDGRPRGTRMGTVLLASLCVACVVFAAFSQARHQTPASSRPPDPLGDLLAQAKGSPAGQGSDLAGKDVTFPSMLSDDPRTTTALAAVRALPAGATSAVEAVIPPPATDRLPVVPLPAKNIVASSPMVSRPRDVLTQMAKEASSMTTPPVAEGHAGGYQLQASSFRSEAEASEFATALRQRGHKAYVEAAQLNGRGTWYRVRVGPFRTQHEAAAYRSEFETREHLAPFIVDPPKDKSPAAKP